MNATFYILGLVKTYIGIEKDWLKYQQNPNQFFLQVGRSMIVCHLKLILLMPVLTYILDKKQISTISFSVSIAFIWLKLVYILGRGIIMHAIFFLNINQAYSLQQN